MTTPSFVANGWIILCHPCFLDQYETLLGKVRRLAESDPAGYRSSREAKLLAAITRLVERDIPADPGAAVFRQGHSLGVDAGTKWFRAKFFQQYRLFFRYDSRTRVIVMAWVNDADTKRAYESDDDAYRVFRRMLERGRPPTDWEQLVAEAGAAELRRATVLG